MTFQKHFFETFRTAIIYKASTSFSSFKQTKKVIALEISQLPRFRPLDSFRSGAGPNVNFHSDVQQQHLAWVQRSGFQRHGVRVNVPFSVEREQPDDH